MGGEKKTPPQNKNQKNQGEKLMEKGQQKMGLQEKQSFPMGSCIKP